MAEANPSQNGPYGDLYNLILEEYRNGTMEIIESPQEASDYLQHLINTYTYTQVTLAACFDSCQSEISRFIRESDGPRIRLSNRIIEMINRPVMDSIIANALNDGSPDENSSDEEQDNRYIEVEQEKGLLNISTNPDKTLSYLILEEYKADLVDIIDTPRKARKYLQHLTDECGYKQAQLASFFDSTTSEIDKFMHHYIHRSKARN